MQGLWPLRLRLNDFAIPGVLPWGRTLLPVLPFPRPLLIVVGAPMQLPRIAKPTKDDVRHWHGKYVERVRELFDKYRDEYYGDDADGAGRPELEIW